MISFFRPELPMPTARQLALVALAAGEPIDGWQTSSVAAAIDAERRAMKPYVSAERVAERDRLLARAL
jgi:hypothetical protein